jgi:hypothetical protein
VEAQGIERFILDCETVTDEYYAIPTGNARVYYRIAHPEVDARLYFIRGLKPRSIEAIKIVNSLAEQYGVSVKLETYESWDDAWKRLLKEHGYK